MRYLIAMAVLLSFAGPAAGQAVLDWAWFYPQPGQSEIQSDMGIDSSGNIVVLGYGPLDENAGKTEIILLKMTPAGDTAWLRTFSSDTTVRGYALDIDALGNIYIAGDIMDPSDGRLQPLVLKYDANGNFVWDHYRFAGGGNVYYGRARDVCVDANNEVYYTADAYNNSPPHGYDVLTAKLRADGTLAWETYYNHDDYNPQSDWGEVIKYRDGYVYTAGVGKDTLVSLSMSRDIVVIKHDTSGAHQWNTEYVAEREWGDDGPRDMAIDGSGNVYVAGYVSGVAGNGWNHEWAVMAFDNAGVFQWDYLYHSGDYYEEARSIVVDHDNNIIATGYINYLLDADFYTVKFAPDGSILWTNRIYHGTGKSDDAYDLVVDGANNIYIGGCSDQSNISAALKMHVTRLDPDANIDWYVEHSGNSPEGDRIQDLLLDGDSVLYAAGFFTLTTDPSDRDIAVARWLLPDCCVLRGDVDGSTAINVSDLTYLVAYLFQGGPMPPCEKEADVDASTTLNVSDLTFLVAFLFQGGSAPVPC